MLMNERAKAVMIEVYDTDGDIQRKIEGRMAGSELLKLLAEFVREEGIPVVRDLTIRKGSVEKGCECHTKAKEALMETSGNTMSKLRECENHSAHRAEPPMVLEYKTKELEFRAAGHAEDVMAASADVMEAMYGKGTGYYVVKGEGEPETLKK